MHYKLKSGEDPFELNPGLLAIEEFKNLTPTQMFFVCLIADQEWDNPLKTMPERQRRERAAMIVGYPMEPGGKRFDKNGRNMINGKVETVEKAIEVYRKNHFDEDEANLAAVDHQIQEARELMMLDKTKEAAGDAKLKYDLAEKAIKLGQGITKLIENRAEIKAMIQAKKPVKLEITTHTAADLMDDNDEMEGDEEMSTIDRVMSKQGNDKTD